MRLRLEITLVFISSLSIRFPTNSRCSFFFILSLSLSLSRFFSRLFIQLIALLFLTYFETLSPVSLSPSPRSVSSRDRYGQPTNSPRFAGSIARVQRNLIATLLFQTKQLNELAPGTQSFVRLHYLHGCARKKGAILRCLMKRIIQSKLCCIKRVEREKETKKKKKNDLPAAICMSGNECLAKRFQQRTFPGLIEKCIKQHRFEE